MARQVKFMVLVALVYLCTFGPPGYSSVAQAQSLAAFNATLAVNSNHPSAYTLDNQVPVPSAPHGIFVSETAGGLGYKKNFTEPSEIAYLVGDPRVAGAEVEIPWNSIEAVNGTYNFSIVVSKCSPFWDASKLCALEIAGVSDGGNQSYTPQFVQDQVTMIASCGTAQGGGNQEVPEVWTLGYYVPWEEMVNFTYTHFMNNASIAYIRYGIGAGGEDFFPTWYTGKCLKTLIGSYGFTPYLWQSYSINATQYLGKIEAANGYKKQLFVSLNPGPGNDGNNETISEMVASAAVSANVGFGAQNFDPTTYIVPYLDGQQCVADMCNLMNEYAGRVPILLQSKGATEIAPGHNGYIDAFLPSVLASGLYEHAQIFELPVQEFLVADDPGFPNSTASCPSPGGNGTETCQQAYNESLTMAANVLGYAPAPSVVGVSSTQTTTTNSTTGTQPGQTVGLIQELWNAIVSFFSNALKKL